MNRSTISLALIAFIFISTNCSTNKQTDAETTVVAEAISTYTTPLGHVKNYAQPSEKLLSQLAEAKSDLQENPDNPENIIWYGRRMAYTGNLDEAIKIYSGGIEKFPDNPRFYRHRGHRYISLRKYDEAIADLERAAELIQGTENEIEEDGMPNARNIPVSSLHGNIYYHLGLAYYLKQEYQNAYDAYINCRNSASNPDNIVSSTHWLYMIQRRMGNTDEAKRALDPIKEGFDVIENTDYYTLCKFYKGLIPEDSIKTGEDSPASDALKYGIANWYLYNSDSIIAKEKFEAMMKGASWTSFGYLAAESDLLHLMNN